MTASRSVGRSCQLCSVHPIRELAESRPEHPSDLDFGPVTESSVREVEDTLGAQLPNEFRDYLLTFAGGLLLGWEIYGVPTPQSKPPATLVDSILEIVEQNRTIQNPQGVIEFANDGGGFFFAFIPPRDPNAVFVRGYGTDWTLLYPSFHDFLHAIADGSISYPRC